MVIVDLRYLSFFRKTKSGGLVKVTRESYLRDDIKCGISGCPKCKCDSVRGISVDDTGILKFIVPSTKVLSAQLDLFCNPSITDVIITQTALESMKNFSLVIYDRFFDLIYNSEKRFFLFYNEHHSEAFYDTPCVEITDQRNTLAIIKVVKWYKMHLGGISEPIFVTNDDDHSAIARANDISCLTISEYVQKLPDAECLLDIVTAGDYHNIIDGRTYMYPEHITFPQIISGLKVGSLHSGKLSIEQHNVFEGSIVCSIDGREQKILISGRENINRAMDGDTVAVEILPESKWKSEGDGKVIEDESDYESDNESDKDMEILDGEVSDKYNKVPCGRVRGITKRAWGTYCGNLDQDFVSKNLNSSGSKVLSLFFWPVNRKIPRIRIQTRQAGRLLGKRIAVTIDSWPKDSMYPVGHYVKTIGDIGSTKTETDVVLMENNIDDLPFSQRVLDCLPIKKEAWKVTEEDLKGREDFRSLCVFSIDPKGCTDIDDALSCKLLDNRCFEVGVHIADVTHFIKPNTALDEEAKNRSTTVYLVDKRVDMIPALLSSNLCSLKEKVDRLSFSCIMELDQNANVVNRRFCKSVICSRASLTYEEAQSIITANKSGYNEEIVTSIKRLNSIAKKLRQRRKEAGALSLDSPELRFELGENIEVLNIEIKQAIDANFLVEEFMLLANIEVAKKIFSRFCSSALLRRHPTPSPSRFEVLSRALLKLGFSLDFENSKALSDSLDKIKTESDPYISKLVRMLVTRCLTQAEYFCSGTLNTSEFWHYGLSVPIYTHFTSPIRRYSDVIVHRELCSAIEFNNEDSGYIYNKEDLLEICEHLNYRYTQAQVAARTSASIFSRKAFENKDIVQTAYITRILGNSFSVIIRDYGLEGFVRCLKNDELSENLSGVRFLPEKQLIETDSGIVLEIFSKVKVRVKVKTPSDSKSKRSEICFNLVEPYIKGLSEE